MLPLYDDNPTRTFPLWTVILIGANVFGFFLEIGAPEGANAFIDRFAMVPALVISQPLSEYPTVFSSMFMHGGIAHLAGNMLYLWIFGNNIEEELGPFKFIVFYLVCGVLAAAGHVLSDVNSTVPMVGASGAISGILGAYVVLFPKARVRTLIFLGFYITMVWIPASILLGIWILLQVANSLTIGAAGGVAFMAHIGGFLAGMVLILPFKSMRRI
jgi:membrane associated rhomboid family serine protease